MPAPSEERARRLQFSGFASPNTTPLPDELFDVLAPELTEGELRVLLYVIRRTFGFKKQHDRISLSQMVNGIKRRDGTVLDRGTGMGKPAVIRSVRSLVELGILTVDKAESEQGDADVNVYSLHFRDGVVLQGNHPGIPREPRVVSQRNDRVVSQENPHETVMQQTVRQEMPRAARQSNHQEPTDELGTLWQATLADLREQIVPTNFARWLCRARLLSCAAGQAVIGAPDQVIVQQLERRFDPLVRRALGDACGEPVVVQYQVDGGEAGRE